MRSAVKFVQKSAQPVRKPSAGDIRRKSGETCAFSSDSSPGNMRTRQDAPKPMARYLILPFSNQHHCPSSDGLLENHQDWLDADTPSGRAALHP
jgi:hypothetical protein